MLNKFGEIIELNEEVKTVEQAAKAMNTSRDRIIKSLLLINNDEPLLVILGGDKKLDSKKLRSKYKKIRFATPQEVREITGYSIGEVPPIIPGIKTIIDESLINKDLVYGGGGAINKLIKIKIKTILDEQKPIIMDVSKDL